MAHNRTLFNTSEDMGALLASDDYSMF